MKKLQLALFTMLSVFTFVGCDSENGDFDLNGQIDGKIASVAEQRIAIDNSIAELRSTMSILKGVDIQKAKVESLVHVHNTTRAQGSEKENGGIYDRISAVEAQADTLQAYVDTIDVEGDWCDITINTLELCDYTLRKLLALQLEVQELKENDVALESRLSEVDVKIAACAESIEKWVNDIFAGYYDIAAIDVLLQEMSEETAASDSAIVTEIDGLREDLVKSNEDMTIAYTKAIEEAIEENNGELKEAAKKTIADINKRIDNEIATINGKIAEIEERLSILEDAVQALLSRIQSVAFIPLYEDESVTVTFPEVGSTSGGCIQMDFLISPKNTVSDLAKYYDKILALKATYLGSSEFIDLPIIACTANATQGTLSLTAATDNLGSDFYYGGVGARVMLFISDGNNDLTSDYIRLDVVPPSKPSNNRIYYTTTDNEPVSGIFFSINEYGEKIENEVISNVYNHKLGRFILTLRESVTSIGDLAFDQCVNLASITIPESVTSIGERAFFGCSSLTSITIPEGVTSIGASAFALCSGLTSITIPEGVTSIGASAFALCSGLTSITIPEGVTSIGGLAFEATAWYDNQPDGVVYMGNFLYCYKGAMPVNTSVEVKKGTKGIAGGAFFGYSSLTSITIPEGVTSIGEWAFSDCSSLTSITIPESVTSIGNCAFDECINLTSITIPESVTSIGDMAFHHCSSLTSITIPESVTSIGLWAFLGCQKLEKIYFEGAMPPSIGSYAFPETSILYVPTNALETYKNSSQFSEYNIQPFLI